MKFFTPVLAILAGSALALPGLVERQLYEPCPDTLYNGAECCSVDVLGVADLDCASPTTVPANATDFQSICADVGKQAMCCVLPILDQGVLCETPVGVAKK